MNLLEHYFDGKKIIIPQHFNFAFDVLDVYAEQSPDQLALIWCNDKDEEKKFTFKEIADKSKQAAAYFQSKGIQRGDKILLSLRRRYEYWIFILALHRLGALAIPCPSGLLKKRFNLPPSISFSKIIYCFCNPAFYERDSRGPGFFSTNRTCKNYGAKRRLPEVFSTRF